MKLRHILSMTLVTAAMALGAVPASAQFGYYPGPIIIPGISSVNSPRTLYFYGQNTPFLMGPGGTYFAGYPYNPYLYGYPPAGSGQENADQTGNGQAENAGNAQSANENLFGGSLIPRTNDTVEARFEKDNRLLIRWSGETRAVSSVIFSLLDKNRNTLAQETVTRPPAEARFTLTNKTAYYRTVVHYVNGTRTTVVSPL
jgi:hypothetical protein